MSEKRENELIVRANDLVERADDLVRQLDALVADVIDTLTSRGTVGA